jgi:lipopolysaccharide/colanic/teichoic acid biosynthesis glycosyltransferase
MSGEVEGGNMNAPTGNVARPTKARSRARARARARAIRMPLMPSLQRRRLQSYIALMIGDIIAITAGFAAAGYFILGAVGLNHALLFAEMVLPIYLTIGLYGDTFALPSLRSHHYSMGTALLTFLVSSSVVLLFTIVVDSRQNVTRKEFLISFAVSALLLVVVRRHMGWFVRWRCGPTVVNELVIDDGGPKISLTGAFHVSAQSFGLSPCLTDPHALDRIGMLLRNADRVVVSSPPERRADWGIILKGANVEGEVIDEAVAQLAARGARLVNGQGLLLVSSGPLSMRGRMQKRAFDVLVAGSALLALSPLLIAVAVMVKLEDGGSILFKQRRVGRSNRFFSIYKFRSMTENKVGRDGSQSASKDDKRVTRIGKLIRKTSVDELPQLLNVLKGDMSLVGPRPHAIGSRAADKLFWEVDTRYWERHALKPGLTGLAQIRGLRGATDSEEDLAGRLYADLEYLNGWSLLRDMWIMMMTVRVLAHDRAF